MKITMHTPRGVFESKEFDEDEFKELLNTLEDFFKGRKIGYIKIACENSTVILNNECFQNTVFEIDQGIDKEFSSLV